MIVCLFYYHCFLIVFIDLLDYFSIFYSLPFITATADGPKHIETTITRAKFEELCSDLLDR